MLPLGKTLMLGSDVERVGSGVERVGSGVGLVGSGALDHHHNHDAFDHAKVKNLEV